MREKRSGVAQHVQESKMETVFTMRPDGFRSGDTTILDGLGYGFLGLVVRAGRPKVKK